MQENAVRLFIKVRNFSSASVAAAIFLSVLFSGFLGKETMGWQIALAIFALAIGIPHGALDHLITLPKNEPKKMAIFIAIYVAVAIIAVIGILKFNIVGFILVLLMSAVHFGIGDTAFINEIDKRSASRAKLLRSAYIPAAGFTPVFIPLVNSASTDALAKVNPSLINWHQGLDQEILTVVTSFAVISIVVLLITRRVREAIDLTLLLALALITPPLIAFAVYFGCWHAMRHTARLTLILPKAIAAASEGEPKKSFFAAVIPGLPALIGTVVVAAVIAITDSNLDASYLWYLLVVVWALTVPHMIVTSKIDQKSLS